MSTRFLKIKYALLALALLLAPVQVMAQTSELIEAARVPYDKGLNAVKQQDWNLAVQYFLAAQKADPYAPATLFNLGLASEKIPGYELRAIAWFQAYLLTAPAAPDAAAVRTEIARLERSFEARNRAILDQLDSLFSLTKKYIDQPQHNPEWARAASSILGWAGDFQAGSHYFVADEAGALRVLHVADENMFRHGHLLIHNSDFGFTKSAMVSASLHIDEIANGAKSSEFTDIEISQLDYFLEVGDMAHAWTFLKGWKANDDLWILGMERFICTAHDRSDGMMFAKASTEIEKTLAGMPDARGYSDLVLLYIQMGEVARAEALAKAIPADLERQTLQRYSLPTVTRLMQLFHRGDIRPHGACPGTLSILAAANSPNQQTLQWGVGGWSPGEWNGIALWWSTGRMAFLTEMGRNGLSERFGSGWNETRLGEYVKTIGNEILADPSSIKNNILELARVEFLISEAYRRVCGPVRGRTP